MPTYDTIFDKPIRYGWSDGGHRGKAVPGTAVDYFNRMGSNFVQIKSGETSYCASNSTTIDGWLEGPKETTHGQAVVLTGKEYNVITDITAVFACPVDERTASLSALHIGESAHVIESGSTTTKKQKVKIGAHGTTMATPLLLIRDVDVDNKTVFVSLNPAKINTGA